MPFTLLVGKTLRHARDRMAKLNDDQRRALKTLAHQNGCAEAMLLADGISMASAAVYKGLAPNRFEDFWRD